MVKTISKIKTDYFLLDNSEKWIKELYQEVDAKTAEKFGKDSLAYKTITNGIDRKNITGSQFFWNTILNQYLTKTQKVILLKDMEEINDLDEDFLAGFFTVFPQILLRTNKPSWKPNKYILKDLIKQVKALKFHGASYNFTSENPLIISNLGLIKDNNSKNIYGLLLKIEKDTKLENDLRFAYSNDEKEIQFGERQKTIYNKENGLSRICLYWDDDLIAKDDILAYSQGIGRTIIKDCQKFTKSL